MGAPDSSFANIDPPGVATQFAIPNNGSDLANGGRSMGAEERVAQEEDRDDVGLDDD
ncbi:hypothetical protein JCGZ_22844 [Jatropha curcas]|uniref:Uncharacterized protein n=1 Tax=Jatropha curcas TaxID=180498 RepID=A0A067K2A1_JATCU|nr:hypothetical protein JCGZ_22844 [Jatropha curcas]